MFFFKNKSVLKSWCIAYLLMMLVVIGTNIYCISSISSQMNSELMLVNNYFLRLLNKNIDSVISETETLEKVISSNDKVAALSDATDIDNLTRFAAAAAVEELSSIAAERNFVLDFMCYFPQSDIVITPEGFSDSRVYFELNASAGAEDYDIWLSQLAGAGGRKFSHGGENMVEITVPVAGKYIIRFFVDNDVMFRPVVTDMSSDAVIILDRRGQTLISSDAAEYDFSNALFEEEYEIRTFNLNGEKMFIYYSNSSKYGYRYVYAAQNNYFRDRLLRVIVIGVGSSILCILCMLVIMIAMSKFNHKKIKSIMDEFDDDDDIRDNEDEFKAIKRKIALSHKQSQSMKEKLESQLHVIKNSFLVNYLSGYTAFKNIDEKLADYNITQRYDNYFIIAIFVRDYGILNDMQPSDVMFAINNIIEDLTDMRDIVRVDIDGMLVYLVNTASDSPDVRGGYIKLLDKVAELLYDNFKITFCGGISRVGRGFDSLPKLYREAAACIDNADFYDLECVLLYDEVSEEGGNFDDSVIRQENEIIASVRLGDYAKAENIINVLFDKGAASTGKWYYEGIMYSVLNSVVSSAGDDNIRLQLDSYMKEYEKHQTVGNMKQILLETARLVCDNEGKKKKTDNEVYRKIIRYVDENFTDTGLNVSSIGEQLGMAPFYISRVFKNSGGVKLVSYINDLRIDYAKKLLAMDDEAGKISDIAAKAGFENVRTFLKVFKEHEGITPTQYRKINGGAV